MNDSARSHHSPTHWLAVAAVLLLGGLLFAGCGSSKSSSAKTTSTTQTTGSSFGDTYLAPKVVNLKLGGSFHVSLKTRNTAGWQASCVAKGRRINAEIVHGQVTRAGRIVSFKGGTPSIWVTFNPDNSITVSCR